MLCQKFGGDLWTNYNESDPGVTILQQLCYAITDLGYRTDFSIEDILTRQNNKIRVEGQFYQANEILPNNALTTEDYRKLLIDQFPQINNAWVSKLHFCGLEIDGYFLTRIELIDSLKTTGPNQKGF